jgi:hypothetical protein
VPRPRQTLVTALLILSALGFVSFAAVWVRLVTSTGDHSMLVLGRGHNVLEFHIDRTTCQATFERYHRPLTYHHPDAPLIRWRNHYGWFVEVRDECYFEDLAGLGFVYHSSVQYGSLSRAPFRTTRTIGAPNACALAFFAVVPSVTAARKIIRRRRPRPCGFDVTLSRPPPPPGTAPTNDVRAAQKESGDLGSRSPALGSLPFKASNY